MRFVLPIKSTYVPSWGTWECVRELVQNAKDEEEQHGHRMTVEYDDGIGGDPETGTLTIRNDGADIERKALLIGQSGKTGSGDLRGKYGEGLNLALLAGTRAGHRIQVFTRSERWLPLIGHDADLGAEVLSIQIDPLARPRSGVAIVMSIARAEWESIRSRFLFLCDISDRWVARVPDRGAILLEPERKGEVYSKGIYVDRLAKLEYGYDLDDLELDRDRRVVNGWDLQWKLGGLYAEAVARRPELLAADVYRMLRDGHEDVQHLRYFTSEKLDETIAALFRAEHGDRAMPVASIAESKLLEHAGMRGVVAPEPMREILRKTLGDPAAAVSRHARAIDAAVAWSDLGEAERSLLGALIQSVAMATRGMAHAGLLVPLVQRLEVVTFRDPKIAGTCDRETRQVRVARWTLSDPHELLKTLVHEEAHAITAASDGEHHHLATIEEIFARLYFTRGLGRDAT